MTPKREFILEIDTLIKSFSRNIVNIRGEAEDERFYIIDDLSLMVPRHNITGLIGGNGAGKTTLFNIISGFMSVDSGSICFNNGERAELIGMQPYKIARCGIGRLFQDNHIFGDMTVMDNMLLAASDRYGEQPFMSLLYPRRSRRLEKERISKARNVFKTLFGSSDPFWDKKDDPAASLSYGQQRLLGLARLFMGDYQLVLLDEPTSGVNPRLINNIKRIIRKLVDEKGVTVFLIEHNMNFVLNIADFCSFMSHGRITAFGAPQDVIGDDEVRRTYLGA